MLAGVEHQADMRPQILRRAGTPRVPDRSARDHDPPRLEQPAPRQPGIDHRPARMAMSSPSRRLSANRSSSVRCTRISGYRGRTRRRTAPPIAADRQWRRHLERAARRGGILGDAPFQVGERIEDRARFLHIGRACLGDGMPARGAGQEADAQPLLQPGDPVGHHRRRDPEPARGG